MKKIAKVLLGSTVLVSLAGCSNQSAEEKKDAKSLYGCDVINIYNWGEYIGEGVNSDFEAMYNAKVNYDLFDSNEIMYTKLLGGSAYDIVIPSDYTIERMINGKMVQKLDLEAIPNVQNVNSKVVEMQKVYDPNLEYSVPYFHGSVGLVYNKNNVDPKLIEEKGWDILQDSQFANRVYMYDSQRDAFMIAFKALGYSMNTESEEEIQKAYEWLMEMAKNVQPAYVTDEVIDGMAHGDKDIAVMYSGDAAYVLSENEDMAWIEPHQGTNIWSDGMVIPVNAACPGLANAYINYVLTYDISRRNSEAVGYTSANEQVEKDLSEDEEQFAGNAAYQPRSDYEKDEVFRFNSVLVQKLSDLWNKVKTN